MMNICDDEFCGAMTAFSRILLINIAHSAHLVWIFFFFLLINAVNVTMQCLCAITINSTIGDNRYYNCMSQQVIYGFCFRIY